jgi:hypothetical protein
MIFDTFRFPFGKMLSWSKSDYRTNHPNNEVFFNCNIFTEEDGKIWYGDVDYTKEYTILEKIATKLDRNLYILKELDGRFDNENLDISQIKKKALKIIKPTKN